MGACLSKEWELGHRKVSPSRASPSRVLEPIDAIEHCQAGTTAKPSLEAISQQKQGQCSKVLRDWLDACQAVSQHTLPGAASQLTGCMSALQQCYMTLPHVEVAVTASIAALQRCFEPVLQAAELHLQGNSNGGFALTHSQPDWERISATQLLAALQSGVTAAYPSCCAQGQLGTLLQPIVHALRHLTATSQSLMVGNAHLPGDKPNTSLILEKQPTNASEASGTPLQVTAADRYVPAINQLASWLVLIYFRKIILDTEAAAGQGEGRLNLTVRRSQALWDALPQVQQQGVLVLCQHPLPALPSPVSTPPPCQSSPLTQPEQLEVQAATGPQGQGHASLFGCQGHSDLVGGQAEQAAGTQQLQARPVKVFPSFVDEVAWGGGDRRPVVEAGEGHGPRKEFFAACGISMVGGQQQQPMAVAREGVQQQQGGGSQGVALLSYNRSAGVYWYNTTLQQSELLVRAYQLCGWLMGQALLCRASLGLPLPPLLFLQLLHPGGPAAWQPSLSHLSTFDPDTAASLRSVASLPPAQLADLLELEGLPSSTTAQQYMQHSLHELLVAGVAWQAGALAHGWWQAVDRQLLGDWGLDPAGLALAVGGLRPGGAVEAGGKLDVRGAFAVVMDRELSPGGAGEVVGQLLWEVVDSWEPEHQAAFLEFVTGYSRLPPPGSELLKVECPFTPLGWQAHKEMLGMLPQAHTCDNLLELPNYWSALLHVRGHLGRDCPPSTHPPPYLDMGRPPPPLPPTPPSLPFAQLPPDALDQLRAECKHLIHERLLLAVLGSQGYGLDQRELDSDVQLPALPLPVLAGPAAARLRSGGAQTLEGAPATATATEPGSRASSQYGKGKAASLPAGLVDEACSPVDEADSASSSHPASVDLTDFSAFRGADQAECPWRPSPQPSAALQAGKAAARLTPQAQALHLLQGGSEAEECLELWGMQLPGQAGAEGGRDTRWGAGTHKGGQVAQSLGSGALRV
ncbi:hypothetical protein V8C86DRAFT_315351 [Haematococcus lacustris]